MTDQGAADEAIVNKFVDAVFARDFDGMQRYLSPSIRFRAFTPGNVFGSFGPETVASTYQYWMGEADRVQEREREIHAVSDRLGVRYLVDCESNSERTLIEQQFYCAIEDGLIVDISLICSGDRPPVD